MGKEAKKHRAKVAKRNAKVKEQKSGMQKAFDLLMKQQIDAMANEENLKAQIGDQELNFEVVEEKTIDHAFKFTPNEEESQKINKEFEGNVSFKEENPEFMSINQITIDDFESNNDEPIEDQISEIEK
jgi:hypothetical protein